jgi:hypothetical protein
VGGTADPLMHENHLGNLVALKSQPNLLLLSVHLAMAVAYIGATMLQKALVARMSGALEDPARDPAAFARYRRIHATVGWSLCLLGLVGIAIAPVITLLNHGNPAMVMFLVGQPLFFLPLITMVLVSARRRDRSIRTHRFWAETAFLGPALASLWAEGLIYVIGRMTPIGPRIGEVAASAFAAAASVVLVVWPAWLARKRGLAADARGH